MRKVTVTFDSNVWENIVDEKKRLAQKIYCDLHEFIKIGSVEPFFFEGISVLESIPKKNRKDYIKNYKATFSFQVGDEEPHITKGSDAPEITEYLQENIPKALKLGFKFIKFPGIGAPALNIDKEYWAPDKVYPLKERLDRSFECAIFIESLGAGKSKLKNRMDGSGARGIVKQTAEDSSLSEKQYAKDVGEWVDGDALSTHYGYGIDYFCTNDQASRAGTASIFLPNNLKQLKDKFGVVVVSPQELVELLNASQKPNETA